jgi:hypothetical protein
MGHRLGRTTHLLALLAACAALHAAAAQAATVYLSTTTDATIGGVAIEDGDIARYDTVAGTATLYFDEDLFAGNENVDSFHVRPNGNLLISTDTNATLAGLAFSEGDVVEYNPSSGVATLFFAESLFLSTANVDAFTLLGNGNYVLSTSAGETLGGLTFEDGDLVEYNPVSGFATLFLDEDLFSADEDIDAVYVMLDGSILLSTTTAATLGGLGFAPGDVIQYFPTSNTAVAFFSGAAFGSTENVDAVFGPEPATGALVAFGLAALARRRACR